MYFLFCFLVFVLPQVLPQNGRAAVLDGDLLRAAESEGGCGFWGAIPANAVPYLLDVWARVAFPAPGKHRFHENGAQQKHKGSDATRGDCV